MAKGKSATARAVALVGPTGVGKTTLMEALLHAAGATDRLGSVAAKTSIGDASPEARARGGSVEVSIASFTYTHDRYALVDLPGACDFAAEADSILPAVDLAIVVCEPDPDKAILLQPYLHELDRLGLPRLFFVNKIDLAHDRLRDLVAAIEAVSAKPIVARQIPIWEGDEAKGYVDLALERAYLYRPGEASTRIDLPSALADRETEARFAMLERLADYDDALMEQLLEDRTPSLDLVFDDLAREMRAGDIAPLFLGAAHSGAGARRLLKALRHETPSAHDTTSRLGVQGPGMLFMKVSHAAPAGRQIFARALGGPVLDGSDFIRANGEKARFSGFFSVFGTQQKRIGDAGDGEIVALARIDIGAPGEWLSTSGAPASIALARTKRLPVFGLALTPTDRSDDVRLTGAIAKLIEEDPSLWFAMEPETQELTLSGQGEAHLRVALERLARRYNVSVRAERPKCAYRETIRSTAHVRGRHKKQSGGHGQYGDVVIDVAPLARGEGFRFEEKIHGGAVPRHYIGAVEMGVRDALERGPLGFPVVDVAVTLVDGSHHAVDSSELAFRTAGRIAMHDALAQSEPVLLEPFDRIEVSAPSAATARITSVLSSRRGQILGLTADAERPGWDKIEAFLPRVERFDLILEVRAATQGLGSYCWTFGHHAELAGRLAEEAVSRARSAA
jgi:elongation factor G